MDGADPWEKASRDARPWAVPATRFVGPAALTRPSPPPSLAAAEGLRYGRGGATRAHRPRPRGNAVSLGDGAEGEKGNGGGELERKRGSAPPARSPPIKRKPVSAKRRFPPGSGTSVVAATTRGGDEGLPARSHGGFTVVLQQAAATAPPSRSDGVLLEAAPANGGPRVLKNLAAPAHPGALMAGGSRRDQEAMAVKSSQGTGTAALVVKDRGRAAVSDKLEVQEMVPVARLPPNKRMLALGRERDVVVAPLASRGRGKMGLDVVAEVIAMHESGSALGQCTMNIVEAMNKGGLDGGVEGYELEEGEIAPTMDIVEAIRKDGLDEAVEAQELEEGEIAPEGHGRRSEEGELAATMETVDAMNKDAFDRAGEGHELEEGEIFPEVHGQEPPEEGEITAEGHGHRSEEGELAATMETVDATNKDAFDRAGEGHELEEGEIFPEVHGQEPPEEGEITAEGHGQELEEGQIAAKGHGRQLKEVEIYADGHGQEPEQGQIAAEGHVHEPGEDDTTTEVDQATQEYQVAVEFMAHKSTAVVDRSKKRFTTRKAVRPTVRAIQKFQLVEIAAKGHDQQLKEGETATEATHVVQKSQVSRETAVGIMGRKTKVTARKTVRAPDAFHKPPLVKGRTFSTISDEAFGPRKKFKAAQIRHSHMEAAFKPALDSKVKLPLKILFVGKDDLIDREASHLEDDDNLKDVAVNEGRVELYVNVPSNINQLEGKSSNPPFSKWRLSEWRHRQHGGQNADARSKVRMTSLTCRRFHFLCRFLVQAVEKRLLEIRRIDLAADKLIRSLPDFIKHEPIVGEVPGVEVGDEFLFRVELAMIGLHRVFQGGIDTATENGKLIAISIVASGGYHDEVSSSGELIYTGSGGKAGGNEVHGDQKLVRGNLVLKNCIDTQTAVRVILGFKGQNTEEASHSKAKEVSIFAYDGLYRVVHFRQEGLPGSRVFKFRLQKIPGQPALPLHLARRMKPSLRPAPSA